MTVLSWEACQGYCFYTCLSILTVTHPSCACIGHSRPALRSNNTSKKSFTIIESIHYEIHHPIHLSSRGGLLGIRVRYAAYRHRILQGTYLCVSTIHDSYFISFFLSLSSPRREEKNGKKIQFILWARTHRTYCRMNVY